MGPKSSKKRFIYISKGVREKIYNDKSSKVNVPRKDRSKDYSQEETYLMLAKLKGILRASYSLTISHSPDHLLSQMSPVITLYVNLILSL